MRRGILLLLALAVLAGAPATWASYPGACRAVNYGGKIRYISIKDDQKVAYFEGVPDPGSRDWKGPWGHDPAAEIEMPKDGYGKGYKRQDPNDYEEGQGVVLFGAQMIHCAIVFDSKGDPSLVVSRYDFTDGKFLDCRVLATVPKTGHKGYGVAAAVYRNRLYLFTASATYASGDGVNFSALPAVAEGLGQYEPMDAVTFYPAQGLPKVLVAFIRDAGEGALAFVTWDGSDLPLHASEVRHFGTSSDRVRMGALVLGTVGGATWDPPYGSFPVGKKVSCVQAIVLSVEATYGHYCVRRYEYDVEADAFSGGGGPGGTTPSTGCGSTRGT